MLPPGDLRAMEVAAYKPYAGPNLIITPQKWVDSACLACAGCPHVETKDPESCGKLAVCHVDVDRGISFGHWTAWFALATTNKELAGELRIEMNVVQMQINAIIPCKKLTLTRCVRMSI